MALTLVAKSLANAVAGTDFIVALVDPGGIGPTKVFTNTTYTLAPTLPALGATNYTVATPAAITGIPQLTTLTAVSIVEPISGNSELGQLKVVLTPNAADTTNASSPMTFTYSPQAIAVTASTAS